ncbi:MAG: transposase [Phycisphaerales bacterium]
MSMSKRRVERQRNLWVNTAEIVTSSGHPFYQRLNQLLQEHGFDGFVEASCESFYAERRGHPSIPPGVYCRMLLIGYFEGIDSERGIAWRCADSLALREFLGYELNHKTPEHSSLSVIRGRIDVETHREVFQWVLKVLAKSDLLKGKTIGIDATVLEANAALRSIVRRDTDQRYEEFLRDLAKASGIESPTREDLAELDRKRPKKGSNQDWHNPNDPDAKITKMKDGRTHLAHKAEHAVDLETGAIVAVTLQGADQGDTTTMATTLSETQQNLAEVREDPQAQEGLHPQELAEVVADKGYHSNETVRTLTQSELCSYVSEPRWRGRRHWKDREAERQAVYANRRRIRGERGKRLFRKRGELLERPFAHCHETGGMRRTHLRTHARILKRLLIHVAGCNLALVMRTVFGLGIPRGLQDLVLGFLRRWIRLACELWRSCK